jgi:hypothetical protein
MKKESAADQRDPDRGDLFHLRNQEPSLERTPGSWLIAQGIRHLHAVDEAGIQAYRHVVELLKARDDAPKLVAEALAAADTHDIPLRWALLYLLADLEHPSAADVFLGAASQTLPKAPERGQGCTTIRDWEVLVRTMAIAGLARVPARDERVEKGLFTLLRKLEEPALRVEVVKALLKIDTKNGERIREILPDDQRFMLYLRRAEERELMVEIDRQDGKDKLARAPRIDQPRTAPTADCHCEVN